MAKRLLLPLASAIALGVVVWALARGSFGGLWVVLGAAAVVLVAALIRTLSANSSDVKSSPELSIEDVARGETTPYNYLGMLLCAGCVGAGLYALTLPGGGSSDLKIKFLGQSIEASHASAGVVLFVVGLLVLLVTGPRRGR